MANLTSEALAEFKEIYKKEHGVDLPDDEAYEQAHRLLDMTEAIYRPIPELKDLDNKLLQIRNRCEKHCPDSVELTALMEEIDSSSKSKKVLDCLLFEVKNGFAIYNVASKIGSNCSANISTLLQMSAELDTALRILSKFYTREYDLVKYLAPTGDRKRPDFLMTSGRQTDAADAKLLEPAEGVDGNKFISKVLDKGREGFRQIEEFHEHEGKITNGYVFVWTHRPVLEALTGYPDHEEYIGRKLAELELPFEPKLIFSAYGQGISDYEPIAGGRE